MRRLIICTGVFIMMCLATTGLLFLAGVSGNSVIASPGGWPTLKSEFPEFEKFEKNPEYYEFVYFPRIKYRKLDVEKWVKNLKPIDDASGKNCYVAIMRSGNKVRFIKIKYLYGRNMAFYSIEDDRIQSAGLLDESRLFMTQVGVVRVAYYYKSVLLDEVVYHRSSQVIPFAKQNPEDKKYGNIYAIDKIEYHKGMDIPKHIYRYKNRNDMEKGKWSLRVDYDKKGKLIKTVHAKGK